MNAEKKSVIAYHLSRLKAGQINTAQAIQEISKVYDPVERELAEAKKTITDLAAEVEFSYRKGLAEATAQAIGQAMQKAKDLGLG